MITRSTLYAVHNHERLRAEDRSIVLYLPKIQTAAKAALWNRLLRSQARSSCALAVIWRADAGVRR